MAASSSYRFGDFTLDCGARQLRRHGEALHLSPKAFELLHMLVEAAPRALSKAEIQDRIWPDTFVVEANLQHLIAEIRRALGDNRDEPQYVRTVFSFGYAFQQAVVVDGPQPEGAICRLTWNDGRVTLADGDYTIGRDAAADVVMDYSTVSRQHARLHVSRGSVVLEDLESKNGTYVGAKRIQGTHTLSDGDDLRFGRVPVKIRISGAANDTDTVHDTGAQSGGGRLMPE
jgi:DNA-binding winged helix-turn-helix (wHTH) protein